MAYLGDLSAGGSARATVIASLWRAAIPRRPRYAWAAGRLSSRRSRRGHIVSAAPVQPVVSQPVLSRSWALARSRPMRRMRRLTWCRRLHAPTGSHLAVLGNPRAAGRALVGRHVRAASQAIVRWIVPGGLRYAIMDDFDRAAPRRPLERRRPRALRTRRRSSAPRHSAVCDEHTADRTATTKKPPKTRGDRLRNWPGVWVSLRQMTSDRVRGLVRRPSWRTARRQADRHRFRQRSICGIPVVSVGS